MLGTGVLVRGDEGLLATASGLWAPFRVPSGPIHVEYELEREVRRDGERLRSAGSPSSLLSIFAADLNALVIERCSQTAVHAGVVGWRGKAVAFPAVSSAGKSTLVA